MRNTPRPFPILRSADAGTDRCRPSTAAAPSHRIQGSFHEDVAHQDHQCCTCGAAIRHPSDEQSGVCTCQGTSGSQCTECTARTWLPRIGKRGGSNFRWVCFEAGGGGLCCNWGPPFIVVDLILSSSVCTSESPLLVPTSSTTSFTQIIAVKHRGPQIASLHTKRGGVLDPKSCLPKRARLSTSFRKGHHIPR